QLFGWDGPPGYNDHNFADVMAGVDWLVESGYADPDRLGVRGHSGGAWLTAWIIGHTHRFQAAVAVAGGAYHQELAYALPPFSTVIEDERGGKPWEVPDVYRRYSPLTYIPNARTPTLLLQGEHDNLVQTELLYTWLQAAGVEVEFVKYRG